MNDFPECEAFTGRRRAICRCEVLTLNTCNGYRVLWGFAPREKRTLRGTVQFGRPPEHAKPIVPAPPKKQSGMVGSELKKIFESLGVNIPGCFTCKSVGAEMNQVGVEECKARRDEFIEGIKQRAKSVSWEAWLIAAMKSVTTGIVFKLNPLDPIPGLFDEAVRRAEEKSTHAESIQ